MKKENGLIINQNKMTDAIGRKEIRNAFFAADKNTIESFYLPIIQITHAIRRNSAV
jgi:hypothetical protein